MPKPKPFVLVVVELGAEWPEWSIDLTKSSGRSVLTQFEGEVPSDFALRVAARVDELTARGTPPALAAIACNERVDPGALRARADAARSLLGVMARRHAGRVLFTAPASSRLRLRRELTRLARELDREWTAAELKTRVCFGHARAGSSVLPRPSVELEVA